MSDTQAILRHYYAAIPEAPKCWGRDGMAAKRYLKEGGDIETFKRVLDEARGGDLRPVLATGLHTVLYSLAKIQDRLRSGGNPKDRPTVHEIRSANSFLDTLVGQILGKGQVNKPRRG